MENSGTEGEAKKKKKKTSFQTGLTEINFESRGSPLGLALYEGSVEQCNQSESPQHRVYPNIPFTNDNSGHPDFLPCPRHSGGASPRCVDAVLQLLVFGTLTIHTVV